MTKGESEAFARVREALAYYADRRSWHGSVCSDSGDRARAALKDAELVATLLDRLADCGTCGNIPSQCSCGIFSV